jgi:hypothetical protein
VRANKNHFHVRAVVEVAASFGAAAPSGRIPAESGYRSSLPEPVGLRSSALPPRGRERPEDEQNAIVDGLLAACRTSLPLGADHLVDAVDALLLAADQEAFLIMLPRMRAAFERLHERQRLTLADKVARRYGIKEAEELTQLGTSLEAGAVMARLDEKTGRILAEWDL